MKYFTLVLVSFLFLGNISISQEYDSSSQGYPILNGDVNMDGQICMDDSIQLIFHLFRDGRELPCIDAADVDRSGYVDLNDVIGGLRHIFYGDLLPDCPIECSLR